MKSRSTLKISFLILISVISFSNAGNTSSPVYSRVRINLSSADDVLKLSSMGLALDGRSRTLENYMDVILNKHEIDLIDNEGFKYTILIQDMKTYLKNRGEVTRSMQNGLLKSSSIDSTSRFKYGSLNGFLTYDELTTELDSLALLYPHLVSKKVQIGTSVEGRAIWMIKISDNPEKDESTSEPAIYYDAVHHAREPVGLSTLMYFVYWLLEKYDNDPRAKHLVDNREIYFVPIVNPDGYEYTKIDTYWRKNRRLNSDSTYGVDLNRNYSVEWGNTIGSSKNPESSTYCGTAPFSEPETQAVRDCVLKINPVIAFSFHSSGEFYLLPGLKKAPSSYDLYTEFSHQFVPPGNLFGNTIDILGYYAAGTTADLFDSLGIVTWIVELSSEMIDGEGFWPKKERIIPIALRHFESMRYIAMVGGAYASLKNIELIGNFTPSDTVTVAIGIKNRGLRLTARNVSFSLSTSYRNASVLQGNVHFGDIDKKEVSYGSGSTAKITLNDSAKCGDIVPMVIAVSQDGLVTEIDTFNFVVGNEKILVFENAENGAGNWKSSGKGAIWDTTSMDCFSGSHSFADSPWEPAKKNSDSYFTLNNSIDLTSAENPYIEFFTKWSFGPNQSSSLWISGDSGKTWKSLEGNYNRYIPFLYFPYGYTGISHWVKERISIKDFSGKNVVIRFHIITGGSNIMDGFYFDNFKISDYVPDKTVIKKLSTQNKTCDFRIIPAGDKAVFHMQSVKMMPVSISIYDCLGRNIWSYSNANFSGDQAVTWNHNEKPGNYHTIIFQYGKEKIVKKFIKLK